MTTMATTLIQWVTRTQTGWMTARAGAAGVSSAIMGGFDRHDCQLFGATLAGNCR